MRRSDGVALWRQIADRIRLLAEGGSLDATRRIPTEHELAARFGVNRHTVRSAIAHLVREGYLRSEQGRGTFATPRRRLSYPIARRTRFSAGLEGQASGLQSVLLGHAQEPADATVAAALQLAVGAALLRLETVSVADEVPVSRATHWLDARRFARMPDLLAHTGSLTASFAALGVDDYTRRSTRISASHAASDDLGALRLAPGAIVLVVEGLNVAPDGSPLQFSRTRFAADRIELTVEGG